MKTFHEVLNPIPCVCNPDIRLAEIRRIPFLKTASPATVDGFYRSLRSEGYQEGAEVSPLRYRDGLFGIVARGTFKVYRFTGDDQFVVFDILSAGDFFMYAPSDVPGLSMFTYPDVIASMTTSCVLYMDVPKLEDFLARDPKLAPAFFAAMGHRMSEQNQRFVRFMTYAAEHRLAFLLGYLLDKGPKKTAHPNLIPFNLTRKDISSMAGLTLETASRILSGFERDGLIRSGRGWVEILDGPKLAALAQAPVL